MFIRRECVVECKFAIDGQRDRVLREQHRTDAVALEASDALRSQVPHEAYLRTGRCVACEVIARTRWARAAPRTARRTTGF